MPVYDFECECGVFPHFRSIAERDSKSVCIVCEQEMARLVSAPNLALMAPLQRMAATRNEQSRHAPRVGGAKSSCCSGPNCQHKKKPARLTREGKPAARASTKKNRRPWMLGH